MSTTPSRRRFIAIIPFAGAALLGACSKEPEPASPAVAEPTRTPPPPTPEPAPAATSSGLPMVDEASAQALALGYVAEATRADTVKFKSYIGGSQCGKCALYTGQAGDAAGGCPLFPAKQVAAVGWCNSWVKKA